MTQPVGQLHAVVVDALSSGQLLAPAFAAHGVPAVSVRSIPGMTERYSFRRGDFVDDICIGTDADGVAARIGQREVLCVVPGAEVGVPLADLLAARFTPDLANDATLAGARRDKELMQRALAAAGLAHIRTTSDRDPRQIHAWLHDQALVGRDLVVKPATSAGTDGTKLIPRGLGWERAWAGLRGRRNALWLRDERVVVQEHIAGPEYVVNTVSYRGRHGLTGVMRSHKRPPGKHFALYDRLDFLDAEEPVVSELYAYSCAVLDALGIRFGAAHSEIILTPQGPLLVETGARLHGGMQPPICRLATGTSQVDLLVSAYVNCRLNPTCYRLRRHVSKVFLTAGRGGQVTNPELLDRIRDLPSCVRIEIEQKLDQVVETTDAFSLLAVVVLAHESRAQVDRDIAAVRLLESRLRFSHSPAEGTADVAS